MLTLRGVVCVTSGCARFDKTLHLALDKTVRAGKSAHIVTADLAEPTLVEPNYMVLVGVCIKPNFVSICEKHPISGTDLRAKKVPKGFLEQAPVKGMLFYIPAF
ncbi:hypothetical protein C4565_08310 [Candidatus Parcubacteria bacterium]|nr:MAG: hypothetical protein C4565_08310 [Candidatus Parcubacteria bacterium]